MELLNGLYRTPRPQLIDESPRHHYQPPDPYGGSHRVKAVAARVEVKHGERNGTRRPAVRQVADATHVRARTHVTRQRAPQPL
jgi:hypothetical protein